MEEQVEEDWMKKEMLCYSLKVSTFYLEMLMYYKDKNELPPIYELKKMIDQKGELLESKFRLTYGTIFSLLLAKDINVRTPF